MIRSLYSGISGLRNHQVKMDITSHNIANVNTSGYKAQRVTFKEGFSQILRGATRPPGNSGGTNPMQAGLGMAVGSIDSLMHQGALQSTGQITDLAVEGRAFFAFSNGEGQFYSRNGALQMDANGNLVSPTNGFRLQGLTANGEGEIEGTAVAGDIRIPYGEKSPAKATEMVGYSCNLDSDSAGVGTVLHTGRYLARATGSDQLTAMFDGRGNDLNIKERDTLRIVYKNAAGLEQTVPLIVGSPAEAAVNVTYVSTLDDLRDRLQTAIPGSTVTINNDGQLSIAGAGGATNLSIKNETRPTSNNFVSNLFLWNGAVNGASAGSVRAPADKLDVVGDLFDAKGETLGLEATYVDPLGATIPGDRIKIGGSIGGENLELDPTGGLEFTYTAATYTPAGALVTPSAGITMQDLLNYIQSRLSLPDRIPNKAGSDNPSVELNQPGVGDTRAPVGGIMIRGQAGKPFAFSGISLSANNADNDKITPTAFNANMIPTELQAARDTTVHSTSIEIFDESGAAHTMTTTFTHSGTPNKWLWEISMNGSEQIFGGNRGTLTFSENGSPSTWSFNDGENVFRFNPMNGAGEMKVDLGIGGPDIFTGITQFRSTTTTAAKEQDGFTMGKLSEISISEDGSINGLYTNGTTKLLAKVLLAEFTNPSGLLRDGDSMWTESNNSGEGTLYQAGLGTSSKIKPGALEMSNVDLASEFTDLITTQRGYQAASKIITTSDQLLQELVQLVR